MIQAVADDDERGSLGMHYTSVPNILKVLNPLFLDDLRKQLEEAGNNSRKLLNLRTRLSKIRVFDPACGSGNFLVIAYKEMRKIEAEINKQRNEPNKNSVIPITNFRGIELRNFSAEIARLALIIAEYQCDVVYLGQKLALAEFLPLEAENWITCGNALRIDWLSVCPPTGTGVKLRRDNLFNTPLDQAEMDFENEGGETYICGNPPYKGSREQSFDQKKDLEGIFSRVTKGWKLLDYVSGWFLKASEYGLGLKCNSAFVATNSICQGQQVPLLWPLIFDLGQEINFAHTSFKWANLANYNAGVSVIIIGIKHKANVSTKSIYYLENETTLCKKVGNINPYLIDAQNHFVNKATYQISKLPEMLSGDKLTDGGNLVLSKAEKDQLVNEYPIIKENIGRLVGGQELIKGILRYTLIIPDHLLDSVKKVPLIANRLNAVSEMRRKSVKKETQALSAFPNKFDYSSFKETPKIVVAQLSSENRDYYPCDLVCLSDVAMAPSLVIYEPEGWLLALIASRIHLVWIGTVCGKLKTDFRYSNTLGWNTFPVPTLTEKNKVDLTKCAEDILLAREEQFPATIADLYAPEKMPENLRAAHDRNDETLERIYIGRRFKNDTERLEKLFELYTKMTAGPNKL